MVCVVVHTYVANVAPAVIVLFAGVDRIYVKNRLVSRNTPPAPGKGLHGAVGYSDLFWAFRCFHRV